VAPLRKENSKANMKTNIHSDKDKEQEAPDGTTVLDRLGAWWCMRFHDSLYLPIHSQVRCRVCHRTRRVEW
jgi:hypothetical protein